MKNVKQLMLFLVVSLMAGFCVASESSSKGGTRNGHINFSDFQKRLQSDSIKVRMATVKALIQALPSQRNLRSLLVEAMNDQSRIVRNAVAEGLVKAEAKAVPFLRIGLKSASARVRMQAATIAMRIGSNDPNVASLLLDSLSHRDSLVRHHAAKALFFLSADPKPILSRNDAVAIIAELLDDEEKSVGSFASGILRNLGEKSISELGKAIKHKRESVRLLAIQALGGMECTAERVLPLLKTAVRDQKEGVREKAKKAISEVCARAKKTKTDPVEKPE